MHQEALTGVRLSSVLFISRQRHRVARTPRRHRRAWCRQERRCPPLACLHACRRHAACARTARQTGSRAVVTAVATFTCAVTPHAAHKAGGVARGNGRCSTAAALVRMQRRALPVRCAATSQNKAVAHRARLTCQAMHQPQSGLAKPERFIISSAEVLSRPCTQRPSFKAAKPRRRFSGPGRLTARSTASLRFLDGVQLRPAARPLAGSAATACSAATLFGAAIRFHTRLLHLTQYARSLVRACGCTCTSGIALNARRERAAIFCLTICTSQSPSTADAAQSPAHRRPDLRA